MADLAITQPDIKKSAQWSVWQLTRAIALVLLGSVAVQFPTSQVADWQQFAFYDPGTVLKGDELLGKGYVPTIDFGYTHGLIPLLYGRVGFGVLGRTPFAYIALTAFAQVGMAYGLAVIAVATGIAARRSALALLLIGLPMAIMPAYLTLTHPLEAMLILLALGAQARGERGKALAIMTVCLFTKPSMAYVYGLVLVGWIVWHERGRVGRIVAELVPAGIAFGTVFLALAGRFGLSPVIHTLLPLTGARTYATTNFGFFKSGLAFWAWPALPDLPLPAWGKVLAAYVLAPPAIYLVAVVAGLVGAAFAVAHLVRRPVNADTADVPAVRNAAWELLLTLAVLHTAFLAGFYGWTGSWTYYSYMPVLMLALVCLLARKRALTAGVMVGMGLSHVTLLVVAIHGWSYKTPRPADGAAAGALAGLWRYPDLTEEWAEAVRMVGSRETLILTNGVLDQLPANLHLPDAWFPQPGIPTEVEVGRIKGQVAKAECIIRWYEYERFDVWNTPEFVPLHGEFEEMGRTARGRFIVLRRAAAGTTARP